MDKVKKMVELRILGAAYLVMWALMFGLPVMWVWNWIMPYLFQLPHIGFWQSWGILFLSASLFKSNTFTYAQNPPSKGTEKQ